MSASEATLVTDTRVSITVTWFGTGMRTGRRFISRTWIVTFVVVVRLGAPSSVTRMLTVTICGPCASDGIHENWPVTGSMAAPIGAFAARLNVSVLVGTSTSVAMTVNE